MTDDTDLTECLDAALNLLHRGLNPIPCHFGVLLENGYHCTCGKIPTPPVPGKSGTGSIGCKGKHPALKEWRQFQTRHATEAELRQWFTVDYPYYNVGIVHGPHANTVAIDSDGDVGADTIREIETELGALPATPTILTGGGGVQYIFRWPAGFDYIASRSGLRPGLDIRATGGFSVAPPSIHVSTQKYRWDCDADIDDIPIADLTQPWIDLVASGGIALTSTPAMPAAVRNADNLVTDGREEFMRNLVHRTYLRLYRRYRGQVNEILLTQEAWNEYSSQVDLSKAGRGFNELTTKVRAILCNKHLTKPLLTPPTFRR
jgi:hypothetical protein